MSLFPFFFIPSIADYINVHRHKKASYSFEMKQKINIEENALKHSGKDKANCEKSLKCFSGRKNQESKFSNK